jgi:4-diphosphocytidyl-2-C-methyl-D-erythritol kinase
MGLQRLFDKPLPAEDVVQALGRIGSDVPFFVIGGRAVGLGRGDEITPLGDDPGDTTYWLVLVDPGIVISTAEAYSWLTVRGRASSIVGFRAQFISSRGAEEEINDFEAPVFARYSELAEIKHELLGLGAFKAALSGSGSTVFGQFRNEADALGAARKLKERFVVKVTRPLSRSEYFQRMIVE